MDKFSYSLGVILYRLISGRVPFHGDDLLAILSQIAQNAPKPPSEHRPATDLRGAETARQVEIPFAVAGFTME